MSESSINYTEESSSPAPTHAAEIRIPDDSILLNFTSCDPTIILDNPKFDEFSIDFDVSQGFEDVSEEVGDMFIKTIELYRDLALININMSILILKRNQPCGLKTTRIYDVLDKFYLDLPDIVAVDAAWVSEASVRSIIDKEKTHAAIKEHLDCLKCLMNGGVCVNSPDLCNNQCKTQQDRQSDKKVFVKPTSCVDIEEPVCDLVAPVVLEVDADISEPFTQVLKKKKGNKRGNKKPKL